jgi:regulator of protease activity HflC (stomatin/prohibitin superfamily)
MAEKLKGGVIVGGLLGGIICTYFSVAHVPQGHRGIVFSKFGGVLVGDNFKLKEGFNFIIPCLHRAIIFDIRTREKIIDLHFGSKGSPFTFLPIYSIFIYKNVDFYIRFTNGVSDV